MCERHARRPPRSQAPHADRGGTRELPELDEAVSTGELTLDQAAAAVEFATPETDAELARVAVGKAPGEISRASRSSSPPTVADDQALYRQPLGGFEVDRWWRVLLLNARLPLELGVEQSFVASRSSCARRITKAAETLDRQAVHRRCPRASHADNRGRAASRSRRRDGTDIGDGDGRDGGRRNAQTTIVHLSEDGSPPLLEGAGVISDATAERFACGSRIEFIKPHGDDLVHTSGGRGVTDTQMRYLYKRSRHCQYPGCSKPNDLEAHHMTPWALGGKTDVNQLTLECGRHHQYIHDHGIRVTGTGKNPIYTSADGRRITADQPHAPPS